jgi:hypothetical protein
VGALCVSGPVPSLLRDGRRRSQQASYTAVVEISAGTQELIAEVPASEADAQWTCGHVDFISVRVKNARCTKEHTTTRNTHCQGRLLGIFPHYELYVGKHGLYG